MAEWRFGAFAQTPPTPVPPPAGPGAPVPPGPTPGGTPAPPGGPSLFRLPAYGPFAGPDQFYPVQFLPKDYKFFLPFVVGFPVTTVGAGASVTLVYNQPSDSDFYVVRQFSYNPSNAQYAAGLGGVLTCVIRIPNVAEITSQPVVMDILFPDQSMPPWTWDVPLVIAAGDSLEIVVVNNDATNSRTVSIALNGIRAYL